MPASIAHFAINTTDTDRARRFCENVFGWTFTAWGPPGFFQITTGAHREASLRGAPHGRRELVLGEHDRF